MGGRRFAKDVGWTALTQAVSLGLGLATSAVVIRLTGLEGQGLYFLVATTISLMSLVFSMGQDTSCIYLVGRRPDRVGAVLANSTVCCVIGSAAGIALTELFGSLLVKGLPPEVARGCLRAIEIALPLACLFRIQQNVALGMRRVSLYNGLTLVNGVVSLAGTAAGILLGPAPILGLLLGWNAGNALSALASSAACLRVSRGAFRIDPTLFREGTAYSLRAWAGAIGGMFFVRVALYLIHAKSTIEAVGQFSLALLLAETLFRLPSAAGPILNAVIASDVEGDRTEFAARVVRHVSLLVLLAGAGVAVAAPFVVPLVWGGAAAPAVRILWILLPGTWFSCMHMMIAGFLAGKGYPMSLVFANAVGIATNVALCCLWIPRWHTTGAAVAVSVSYLAGFLCVYGHMRRVYRLKASNLFLLRKGELAGLGAFLRGLAGA